MKQLVHNLGTGKAAVATVSDPLIRPGQVTIANAASVPTRCAACSKRSVTRV